jgi:hypothetical protein
MINRLALIFQGFYALSCIVRNCNIEHIATQQSGMSREEFAQLFSTRRQTMVAVTYGSARGATSKAKSGKTGATTGKKGKGIFARVFDAIAESQMKRAERELALYRHLLPDDFRLDPMNWSGKDNRTPFGGW